MDAHHHHSSLSESSPSPGCLQGIKQAPLGPAERPGALYLFGGCQCIPFEVTWAQLLGKDAAFCPIPRLGSFVYADRLAVLSVLIGCKSGSYS